MTELAARAATLSELLAEGKAGGVDREAWGAAIDPLLPKLLDQRLRFKGGPRDDSWLSAAGDVIAGLSEDGARSDDDLPFGPLWAPLADREAARLAPAFPASCARRFLLKQLCAASARCLLTELAVFRGINSQSFLSFDAESGLAFDAFLAEIRRTGGRELFDAYPALLRVLAVTLAQWRTNVRTLSGRLAADFPDAGIADVVFGLSDPHEGGQTVAIVTFSSGRRLVYKPKPLATEAWYAEHFQGLETIVKDGYGYVEFAETVDFKTESEVEGYFTAAGELLFRMWLLGASDLHFENVVATGRGPMPIDLETLCCPRPKIPADAQDAANRAQHEFYFDSVVRTMLLPRFELMADNRVVEPSGLAGGMQGKSVDAWRWLSLNRDRMRLSRVKTEAHAGANLPRLKGEAVAAAGYLGRIERGFADAYRAAMEPEARRRIESSLETLSVLPTRFVFRNTKIYRHLLDKSLAAEALHSGAAHSLAFEPLWRALAGASEEERERMGRCTAAELAALARRDVPVFKTRPCDSFVACGGVRALELNEAPIELCRDRLARLDEKGLERQLRFLRASFHALTAGGAAAPGRAGGRASNAGEASIPAFVKRIADGILDSALVSEGDESWWLSLCFNEQSRNYQYGPVGSRLFDGALGISLFLAASERMTGDRRAGRAALATARLVAKDSKRYGMARLVRNLGLGAATGAASIPYGLHAIGTVMRDDGLLDDARLLARELSPRHLAADDRRHADVAAGAAGALLVLARLGPDAAPADVRRELEDAFKRGCEELKTDLASGAKPALGFAHGAAGAAYACAALGWAGLAEELVALANARFDAAAGNWPDHRDFGQGDRPRFVSSWCGGAAGIGLGRLECARLLKSSAFDEDAARAVAAVARDEGREPVDHLCCGEAGAIAFLRRAGREEDARRRLARLMAQGPLRMGFDAGVPLPSLFQGEAGVGFVAARFELADLPDVAVFA